MTPFILLPFAARLIYLTSPCHEEGKTEVAFHQRAFFDYQLPFIPNHLPAEPFINMGLA